MASSRHLLPIWECSGHIDVSARYRGKIATSVQAPIILDKLSIVLVHRDYQGSEIIKSHTVPSKVTDHWPRGTGISQEAVIDGQNWPWLSRAAFDAISKITATPDLEKQTCSPSLSARNYLIIIFILGSQYGRVRIQLLATIKGFLYKKRKVKQAHLKKKKIKACDTTPNYAITALGS